MQFEAEKPIDAGFAASSALGKDFVRMNKEEA
jgi:hypothetical protein